MLFWSIAIAAHSCFKIELLRVYLFEKKLHGINDLWMKTNLLKNALASALLLGSISELRAQQVDAQYLNPKHISTGTYEFLRFGTPSSYQAGFMFNETSATYGDGDDFSIFTYGHRDMTLQTGNGNLIVFPTLGGNMGVGTKSPDIKFEVYESSGASTIAEFRTPDGAIQLAASGPLTQNPTYGNYITSRNASNTSYEDFGLKTAPGIPQLLVKTDGSVGIGTASPAEKLHVNGSLRGHVSGAVRISTGNGYVDVGPQNSSYSHFTTDRNRFYFNKEIVVNSGIVTSYDEDLRLRAQGVDGLVVKVNTGSVGIGTTTPTEKLEVNGTIRSKEVKVEASPWPDYVFEPNYNLRSLEEIEKFIKSEKHLPEIPSSAEVEENGIALGEMNALLLKKIEELTLHIIEQEKRIKKLEDEK